MDLFRTNVCPISSLFIIINNLTAILNDIEVTK